MSQQDRHKWNKRYLQQQNDLSEPAEFLAALVDLIPTTGRALDVAGGAGRNAVWLAERGLETTLVDVSTAGLKIAQREAASRGVEIDCVECDLEIDPLPNGPWQLIVQSCYLQRNLISTFIDELAPGGLLAIAQPTEVNLERWNAPPAKYLLKRGELKRLVNPLKIVTLSEAWRASGRHEAWLIAQKLTGIRQT